MKTSASWNSNGSQSLLPRLIHNLSFFHSMVRQQVILARELVRTGWQPLPWAEVSSKVSFRKPRSIQLFRTTQKDWSKLPALVSSEKPLMIALTSSRNTLHEIIGLKFKEDLSDKGISWCFEMTRSLLEFKVWTYFVKIPIF